MVDHERETADQAARIAAERPFVTVRDVARALGWHTATIHRHTCPLSEWKRERGLIPVVRFGKRDYIPRWWLDETLRALTVPAAPK